MFKDEDGDKSYEAAMVSPENYVLKPQREGGGINVYGECHTFSDTISRKSLGTSIVQLSIILFSISVTSIPGA